MANPFAGGLLTADAIGGAGELSHPHHLSPTLRPHPPRGLISLSAMNLALLRALDPARPHLPPQ
jgi:hypothetical protein